jgi:hypothetical protein
MFGILFVAAQMIVLHAGADNTRNLHAAPRTFDPNVSSQTVPSVQFRGCKAFESPNYRGRETNLSDGDQSYNALSIACHRYCSAGLVVGRSTSPYQWVEQSANVDPGMVNWIDVKCFDTTPSQASQGMEDNTDRPGDDFATDIPVETGMGAAMPLTAETCRAACAGWYVKDCRAWTYVRPGVQGPGAVCYIKDRIPPPVPNACCISGTIRRPTDAVFEQIRSPSVASTSQGRNGVTQTNPQSGSTVHGITELSSSSGYATPTQPRKSPPVADVTTGLFDTNFGVLSMGRYNGTYSHNSGKVTVAGRSDTAIDGDWEEFPGTQRCVDGRYRGHFHFEFNQAGFIGSYDYCDAKATAGHWNGTRR